MLIDEKQSIWSEKYKPQTIDDVILFRNNVGENVKIKAAGGTAIIAERC